MGRTHLAKLKQQIKEAKERKKYLQDYSNKLHFHYANGRLTYSNLVETLHKKHDGKNIHELIEHYDNHVKHCESEIKKHKKNLVKNHTLNIIIFSVILIALTSIFSQISNISLTGFFISEGENATIGNETNETNITVIPEEIKNETNVTISNETPENITPEINITPPNESNITEVNITPTDNVTSEENMNDFYYETTNQLPAKINEPVKWKKTISVEKSGRIKISIPKESSNIIFKEGGSVKQMSPSRATFNETQIDIEASVTEYEIEYETPAPLVIEETISRGKRISISSPDSIHYTNILAFASLPESLKIKNPSRVKIKWVEQNTFISPSSILDKDSNGFYDYVEWQVPSLSNQTFEIIVITKAEHLDKNRNFLSDIYEEVKKLDSVWSEEIPNQDYVRVTFEANLTSKNDITIFPRKIQGNPKIEIYEINSATKIAEFTNIKDNEYNKVLLNNLQNSQDTFDLKILGGSVEFDHIIDPHLGTLTISGATTLCGSYNNVYDKIVITGTGVLNICAYNGSVETGFVNITLGPAGNFTVYPGGLVNGTGRGTTGGAGTTSTAAAATQGTNGNNWTTGAASTVANGGGGGGGSRNDAGAGAGGGGGGFGGGGGAGGATTESAGEVRGGAGVVYSSTNDLTLRSGSGGGGGAGDNTPGNGGRGGAGFKVDVGLGTIRVAGFVNLTGFNGIVASGQDSGAGGGGSGGHLILKGASIDVSSSILNVSGGTGGNSAGTGTDDAGGGGGGAGRIYIVYSTLTNTSVTYSANGGSAGTGGSGTASAAGSAGTVIFNQTADFFTDNPPKWYNPSTNNSNPPLGDIVIHNVNWTDDGELFFATLEVNSSGASCDTAANVSATQFNGTSNWSNLSWTIPSACEGKTVGWRIYAKDFPGNKTNSTDLQMYQVQPINPIVELGTNIPDNTIRSNSSVTFDLRAYDNTGISYLNLYGNWTGTWTVNQSNSSPINATYWSVTVDNIPQGKYKWGAWANDTLNNPAFSSANRTFTIDTQGPEITLPFYTNATLKQNTETLTLNVSISDATTSPSACKIDINGTNQTYDVSSGWCNITDGFLTGLADGNRTINVYANDSANNWNFNNSYVVKIISAPSAINLNYPVNNTNTSLNPIIFSVTPIDGIDSSGLNTSIYGNWTGSWHLNASNTSSLNNTQTNFSISDIPDGKYIWSATVRNSFNIILINTTNYTFTKDTQGPSVTLPFYENATTKTSSSTLTLNISVTDVTLSPSACKIDINGTNQTYDVSSGWCNITDGFLTGLADGNRTINIYANDSANNWNFNNSYVVKIISNVAPTIPTVNSSFTINPTESSFKGIVFNFTVNDENGGGNIDLTKAKAYFQKTGQTTRQNTSCINQTPAIGNNLNFTCNISMWYFDQPGAWTINVSIQDNLGLYVENATETFTYNTLTAMVMSPTSLGWNQILSGETNIGSNNDPILINNTGNDEVLDVNVKAYDLRGETTTTEFIFAANFSVENTAQGCTGTSMINATAANITSTRLVNGNNSLNYLNETSGQEQIYFCIKGLPAEISPQSYSSSYLGSWEVSILLALIIPRLRKKKLLQNDKLVQALRLIKDDTETNYTEEKANIIDSLTREISKKHRVNRREINELLSVKEIEIPISIFTKDLGILETIVRYLKENKAMSYKEISELIHRNERTIWTAYSKSLEKKKSSLNIKPSTKIPIAVFSKNKTPLESIIIYLKEKGLKYSEIAKLLDRDQRNINSAYKKAKNKKIQ